MFEILTKPKSILAISFIIGLSVLVYTLTLNYYTNESTKQKLDTEVVQENSKLTKDQYYIEVAKIETSKRKMMDFGTGLALVSLTLLSFAWYQKIEHFADLKKIESIKKITVLVSANIVWLLMIPGTYFYYFFRAMRNDYPWFADSIGIPIMSQTSVILMAFIPLNIVLIISLYKSKLPTALLKSINFKTIPDKLWETFWGLLLLVNILSLIIFVVDGDHISILVNLFFMYVILTLRAGKINYKLTT